VDRGLWLSAGGVIWLHTYGEAYADPDARRPAGDVRLPTDDPRQAPGDAACHRRVLAGLVDRRAATGKRDG
jgi:hypothetical protein